MMLFMGLANFSMAQCSDCKTLEEAFKEPEKVKHLKVSSFLSGDVLEEFPENIDTFVNVEVIYLSGHEFSQVSKDITQLKKLQVLSFAECMIEELPEEIFEMVNLKELILLGNPFSEEYKLEIKAKFKAKMPRTKVFL